MSDKIQLAKIAMSYAGAAKSGATTEYERQMPDTIWFLAVLTGDVGRIYAIRPHDEDLQCGMGSALIQPSHTGGLLWFTLTQRSRPDTDFK